MYTSSSQYILGADGIYQAHISARYRKYKLGTENSYYVQTIYIR